MQHGDLGAWNLRWGMVARVLDWDFAPRAGTLAGS